MIKVICNRCGIDMTKSGAFGRITMEIHKRSDFADSPPESMMRMLFLQKMYGYNL